MFGMGDEKRSHPALTLLAAVARDEHIELVESSLPFVANHAPSRKRRGRQLRPLQAVAEFTQLGQYYRHPIGAAHIHIGEDVDRRRERRLYGLT